MKVLIVDDAATPRAMLKKYLSVYGDCHPAVNGREAVNMYQEALEENDPYDLICMDITMPELDGQEALKEIRRIEKEKNLGWSSCAKVIMITSSNDTETIKAAFLEGRCDAFMTKPVDQYVLVEQVRKLGLLL